MSNIRCRVVALLACVVAMQLNSAIAVCSSSYISCPNARCIRASTVCDGYNNCGDKSDEAYCLNPRPITCPAHQFQCPNGECIPKNKYCNREGNCVDLGDEFYCNLESPVKCPQHWFKCIDGRRCIQENWKCDGSKDCQDGSDEIGCGDTLLPPSIRGSLLGVTDARSKGIRWLLNRRKADSSHDRWGPQLHRIATALYLSDPSYFAPGNKTGEDIGYELTIQLLNKLSGNNTLRNEELALYLQALHVTCIDTRDFFGRNLVAELRRRVEESNYTNPFEILALCNVKDNMTAKDIERVTTSFDSPLRPFWTDTQAIATMALQCLSSSPNVRVDERTVKDMQDELKKRQFRNGTVDNPITTALVFQALLSNGSYNEFFSTVSAVTILLQNQRASGSWGSIRNSYYVLPVLSFKSLLNISSEHCVKRTESEDETLQKLQDVKGDKFIVQYSVWIGDEVDLGRTWRIRMKASQNTSFYDVIEIVKRLDSKHNVTYNVVDNKPYVSSLFGKEDDPEMGVYWFTYVRSLEPPGSPKLIERSPVDVMVQPMQELILWYKPGKWTSNENSQPEGSL